MTTPPADRRPLYRRPDITDPDPAPARPGLRRLAAELIEAGPGADAPPAPPATPGRRLLADPGGR
ncbi:hypothetical protein [Kitasatospora sp. NPDC015120]|uniref:hypothetical protein n=1 Tax=Kitasatospora sp. NPDC015120 TaxID=3364023 RepID=UPI0036F47DD0